MPPKRKLKPLRKSKPKVSKLVPESFVDLTKFTQPNLRRVGIYDLLAVATDGRLIVNVGEEWVPWVYTEWFKADELARVFDQTMCAVCKRKPKLKRIDATLSRASGCTFVRATIPAVCTGNCQSKLISSLWLDGPLLFEATSMDLAVNLAMQTIYGKRTGFLDIPAQAIDCLDFIRQEAAPMIWYANRFRLKGELPTSNLIPRLRAILSWIYLSLRLRFYPVDNLAQTGLTQDRLNEVCSTLYYDNGKRSKVSQSNHCYLVRNYDLEKGECPPIEQTQAINLFPTMGSVKAEEKTVEDTSLCWHGSGMINWYSILDGLKVLSGTAMMSAGAAYGVGIYAAKNSAYSLNYCAKNLDRKAGATGWSKSMFGFNFRCLGLLKIDRAERFLKSQAEGIYVIDKPDCVRVKFLFLFS